MLILNDGREGLLKYRGLILGNESLGIARDSYHGMGGSSSGCRRMPQFGQSGGTARQAVHSIRPGMARPAMNSRAARERWIRLFIGQYLRKLNELSKNEDLQVQQKRDCRIRSQHDELRSGTIIVRNCTRSNPCKH